ncbi:MAG: AmmeMemoRadiSam system protein A [Kiritimatiellae bacterium]|nr:AmmeMemoRadiSam system protein A [Kiritimatiellia bacterium]
MNDDDKKRLLMLARASIKYYLKNGRLASVKELDAKITPGMSQIMGGFVTLHKNGQLRGCIGEIFPTRELYKVVMERAVDSAFNDYRFRPLTDEEFDAIDIEISALSMPEPVESWKDIIIGKHGMTLEKNGRSAVFLPQVAPEQGWGIEETLTHLAVKAGLSPDDWESGCSFKVFEAIVF